MSNSSYYGPYSAVFGPNGTAIENVTINSRDHSIPMQLPPPVDHFINRTAELSRIITELLSGQVVTLCGPGGIGKTALATEAVWRLDSDKKLPEIFPDGIIFHSFYGRPETAHFFEHVIRSFDKEARDFSPDEAFRILSGKKALLMLDGTEEADDLRKVLDIRGKCGVIVTSRQKKDAEAEREDIAPLPTDEAVKLLQAWGGDQAKNEEAARQICEIIGGLPLAVRLAGRYLLETGDPASEYLEWLKETPLEALDQGKRKLESVSLLIRRSLDQVSEAAKQILSVCGQLALSSFSREMLSAVFPEFQIRKPLNELILYSLVQKSGDRFEITQSLIYKYALTEILLEQIAFERLVDYYKTFVKKQSKKGLEGYAWIDLERAHILRIIKGCGDRKYWQGVSALVKVLDNYLDIQGYWTDRVLAIELGLIAAKKMKNQQDEGDFSTSIGLAYHSLGQMDNAIKYYQKALAIQKKIGSRRAEGFVLGDLGIAYYSLGQMDNAIKYQKQALVISRETGDRRAEGNWLYNLGIAYYSIGQGDNALEYHELSLAICRETGDRRAEGNCLGNLGLVWSDLGQVDKAIEYYQQALIIAKEIGDRLNEGNWIGNLGLVYASLGQVDKARQYTEQALTIFEQIKSPKVDIARKQLAELSKQ